QVPAAATVAKQLAGDTDPAVRVEAALTRGEAAQIRSALLDALGHGAANDVHLRYEAAWHLARHADQAAFNQLLQADTVDLRLAGLIALDVACYENFTSKAVALDILARNLCEPAHLEDAEHLVTLARLNWDKALVPGLEKLLARADTPGPAT